ncbi:hypothetical protein [Streptomyces shenzhenensis]|uniref:hypothetical protein n=1 Tax=Streptomyces shenzhenensis TaxID=943815 RepID=UPI0033C47F59
MKSRSTPATWLGGLDGSRPARVLGARKAAMSLLADRLRRPASVAPVLPRLALPYLQKAEAPAALGAPTSHKALAGLRRAADDETMRELEAAPEVPADHALVRPDGAGKFRMAGPLRQARDAPLGPHPRATSWKAGSPDSS